MNKKFFSAVILSCSLLFTSCGDENSVSSQNSEEVSSVTSSAEIESETSEISSVEEETSIIEEESTSAEELTATPVENKVDIVPTDFFTSYGDDVIDFSGVEMNVLNVLKTTKSDTEVAQFSSSKRRDAGCMTTTKLYSGITSVVISQLESGYDGFVTFSASKDGVNYTEVEDSETESDFEYTFNLEGSNFFKITDGSSDYALYLTSIVFNVD